MSSRADGVRVAQPLFQAEGGGSLPTSALDLWFLECGVDTAIALNRNWHSRLPKVVRSNITRSPRMVCYVAEFKGIYYATAIWTNPVARMLPQEWMELRRMAIAPDAPRNTASRMLAWMTRDIAKRFLGTPRLISYQDCAVHTGGIYKAAGWNPTTKSDGGEWTRPSRERKSMQTTAEKQRWEKSI